MIHCLFLSLVLLASGFGAETRPNIIIIMADDMGYSDIGCYGGEIKTPNLDALAANGMRFTQFYNTARCCPTRATLLTGLYAHQAGIGHMTSNYGIPQYQGFLNKECLTIAEALKPAGYRTYMSGKWHVTPKVKATDPKDNWPRQRGFDKFFGTIHGAGSFFDPNSLTRGNTQITPENDPGYKPKGTWYYTDAISDNTVNYLKSHFEDYPDKPFFHYVAYTAAHWPMQALPEDIAKYEGKYDDGYDPTYQARLKKMKQLGLIDPKWEIPGPIGDWSKVELKEWESACMEVYAAMVDNMDQGIGRIVQALKDHKQLDNTLILYLQDNGGCAEGFGRGKLVGPLERPTKPTLKPMGKDELQTNMVPLQSRDGYPLRRGDGVMPGPPETEVGYGQNWANVSNTPFREYKHWVHEGGISTPLIAHWPKGIAGKNTWAKDPTHLIDLMATCIDLGKATYPSTKIPVEGTSLVPALKGSPIKRGKPIFFEHEGNRAVRDGKWKLVAKSVKGKWELYNIPADRTEMNNLADKNPDRVKTMTAQYETWAKERGIVPFGSWNKNKKAKASPKKEFNLKPGDPFTSETSPNIAKRPFTVSATIEKLPATGVIVAQGGSSHGWSLYLKDGNLAFTVRKGGKSITATAPLPKDATGSFEARVTKKGIILRSDNKRLTLKEGNALLAEHPIDTFEIGQDNGGLVGDYEQGFNLSVPLKSLKISIK
jgi:arylsulfatase|tara:strand:- start:12587 stop:14722 length:2136 start_codon:yes stop_codon:yes gene_type:complete